MANDRPPQDRQRVREGRRRDPRLQPISVAIVLGDAWYLYTRFLARFVAIGAVVFTIVAAFQLLANETRELAPFMVFVLASVVGSFWLHGAIVVAVDDARRGGPDLSIDEVFRRVVPHLWRLVGAGLLVAVGVAAGLVALIVPGLVLLTYWSMVTPAIVLENRDVRGGLRRSWQLVKGDALRVFVVIVVTIVTATLISVVTTQLLAPLPDRVDNFVATVLANGITVPFVALTWTVMYFELRLNRDPDSIPWETGRDSWD